MDLLMLFHTPLYHLLLSYLLPLMNYPACVDLLLVPPLLLECYSHEVEGNCQLLPGVPSIGVLSAPGVLNYLGT